ncbi:phosphoribosylanthranilate isomerase [Oscillochloris trichoides DG-6]|uniref:N-(5'-phosphoribosyl)anthranilate isomerase n=1 Tax=Oscillochloris trichoides DG-6 TaxID=765420 RepID=E1IAL5_9CHLR|nr:phosphoribosylanthranilate isomerase [Oscillochloris trichoides]EFO81789.1 phosphoribosylanthranilate isomerase [Oscillochloris trichoides DG-6]
MQIKICGLRSIEHALAAAEAGADMVGLVFAPSRRQVQLEEAAQMVAALRRSPPPHPQVVGLFVNASVATINAVITTVGLDLVQLSGDEVLVEMAGIERPVLKSIRMDGSMGEAAWIGSGMRLLVDAHVNGAYGGTGIRADWRRAADMAREHPLILAGGLDADNVAEAIRQVQPWGVDVSSGVEEDGVKSRTKIHAFIRAAREALR